MAHNFDFLVSEAISPNSDLEHAVRGLLVFAQKNATKEDKEQFISWLDNKMMLGAMYTANTKPGDWFECAEGKTWQEMEDYYYNEN